MTSEEIIEVGDITSSPDVDPKTREIIGEIRREVASMKLCHVATRAAMAKAERHAGVIGRLADMLSKQEQTVPDACLMPDIDWSAFEDWDQTEEQPARPRWQDRLVFDFNVSDESPVVKGTWVTVAQIVSLIVDGQTWSDILGSHPELTEDDVSCCLAYATGQENDAKEGDDV